MVVSVGQVSPTCELDKDTCEPDKEQEPASSVRAGEI